MSGYDDFEYLKTSFAGVDWSMKVEDGQVHILASQDISAALEYNKNCYNWNDGFSKSRELRRAAHIPNIIKYKWLNEEGWNCDDAAKDPDVMRKLVQKLNDPDWRFLRTAEGNISGTEGRHI